MSKYFEYRTKRMAELMPDDVKTILDLGCGNERLRNVIDSDITYYGLDYVKRSENTIICDVNREHLPKIEVDLYFMAGFLTYVNDMGLLFSQMTGAKYILFSWIDETRYLRLDSKVIDDGKSPSFVLNNRGKIISMADIVNSLSENGFYIKRLVYDYKNYDTYLVLTENIQNIEK